MFIEKVTSRLYQATIKTPKVYVQTLGFSHFDACQNALKEYFKFY